MNDVQLFCGDCLEIMKALPLKSVDVVITDPPFGTGTYFTDNSVSSDCFSVIRRLVPTGPIAMFGYADKLFNWHKYFDGLKLIGFITWYHYNAIIITPGLSRIQQNIAIWGQSLRQINSDAVREPYSPFAENSAATAKYHCGVSKKFDERSERLRHNGRKPRHPLGRRCTDVWMFYQPNYGFNSKNRKHPNEKPIEIMNRLVLLLSSPGATVLDPFMGSGSTGVACVQMGRNFIGIEIDENYFRIAEKRITDAQAQLKLPIDLA